MGFGGRLIEDKYIQGGNPKTQNGTRKMHCIWSLSVRQRTRETAWCDGVEEVDGFVDNPVPATRQPPLPLLFPRNCRLFCWWHAIKRKARLGNDFYLLSLDTGKQLAIEVGTTTQSCRKRHPSSQQRQQQQLQRQHTQRHSTAIPYNDGTGVYQPCSPRHWGLWSSEMSISPNQHPIRGAPFLLLGISCLVRERMATLPE